MVEDENENEDRDRRGDPESFIEFIRGLRESIAESGLAAQEVLSVEGEAGGRGSQVHPEADTSDVPESPEADTDAEGQAERVGPKPITLKTSWFEAQALPLFLMPGMQVVDIMATTDEGLKMAKMVGLLQLAVRESDKDKLGLLDMRELNGMMNQWVEKSGQEEAKEDYFAKKREREAERGRKRGFGSTYS